MSFTTVFGGSPVQPSQVSYIPLNLNNVTGNIQLAWASQFQNTNLVVSHIIDVNCTNAGHTLTMPDARLVSVGQDVLISNVGTQSFNLNKFDNTLLTTISIINPGNIFYIYLIDNTTAGGTWRLSPFGGGTVGITSINAVSTSPDLVVTGGPITAAGTFTFSLAEDLSPDQVLSPPGPPNTGGLTSFGLTTGIAARTAENLWTLRTLQADVTNNIVITNANGVAGNPTFGLNQVITELTSIAVGNFLIASNTISDISAGSNIIISPSGTGILESTNSIRINDGKSLFLYDGANANSYSLFSPALLPGSYPISLPAVLPLVGQVLQISAANVFSWASVSTFAGASTVNAIAKYSNTTGGLENSGVLIDGGNNITGATSVQVGNINLSANVITTTVGDLTLSAVGGSEVHSLKDLFLDGDTSLNFVSVSTFTTSIKASAASAANLDWRWMPAYPAASNSIVQSSSAGLLTVSPLLAVAADKAAMIAATSGVNPVVPLNTQYHPGVAKAWVSFDGLTGIVNGTAVYNITSPIVRTAVGRYVITFNPTPFTTAFYIALGTASGTAATPASYGFVVCVAKTTTTATIETTNLAGANTDFTDISVCFFGTQ